jgi:hypothetical protein
MTLTVLKGPCIFITMCTTIKKKKIKNETEKKKRSIGCDQYRNSTEARIFPGQ